ncbi:MAG: helix-turn-helix transcriptional regulator [Erysipelotrichia bacterium]|nr:helix-turn-helix transcriptional regulator [Erysipelotrichia bacterium]
MKKEDVNLQELLANNLTHYRKASGLTQLELAQKFNYSDKSVSKWERGEGFPDIFVLKSLADFYGITIDDFYITDHKPVKIKNQEKRKQTYLQLFSIGLVWVATLAIFMILSVLIGDEAVFKPWLIFIYGVVATFVVLLIWHTIYHLRFLKLFSVSLTIWSVATAFFLSFYVMMDLNLYLVFFVAIPLQILEVLWYFFRSKNLRKIK